MTGIFQHYSSMQKAIDFTQESQRVIGQNLANVNTPGYRAMEVPFAQLLSRLENDDLGGEYVTEESAGLTVRADGNNVDLDHELATMKKNSMAFQTLAQMLGSKMGILKRAIEG